MRGLLILFFGITLASAAVTEPVDGVVEGEPQPVTLLNAGTNLWQVKRVGSEERYHFWLSICLDLPGGGELRSACVTELRTLTPLPSLLVSGFHVAKAALPTKDDPWLVAIGIEVPVAVARSVLKTVRSHFTGPLVVRGWNDSKKIISISPVPEHEGKPTDSETLDRLCGQINDSTFRTLAGLQSTTKQVFPSPETTDLTANKIVDLDLRSSDGKQPESTSALQTAGVTWTISGLYLPGHRLLHFPQKYPTKQVEAPIPTASYRADIQLPDDNRHAMTVTLVICQASNEKERDNIFSIGRRSRWLSAQTGKDGEVIVGLENCWVLIPAQAAGNKNVTLTVGTWHVMTVGVSDRGLKIRVMVDGKAANEVFRPAIAGDIIPRQINETGNNFLSFVDPGTPRHVHGFIQRIIIHRGLLSVGAMEELQQSLPTKDIEPPANELMRLPITGAVAVDPETDEPKKPKPENANEF